MKHMKKTSRSYIFFFKLGVFLTGLRNEERFYQSELNMRKHPYILDNKMSLSRASDWKNLKSLPSIENSLLIINFFSENISNNETNKYIVEASSRINKHRNIEIEKPGPLIHKLNDLINMANDIFPFCDIDLFDIHRPRLIDFSQSFSFNRIWLEFFRLYSADILEMHLLKQERTSDDSKTPLLERISHIEQKIFEPLNQYDVKPFLNIAELRIED